MSARLYLTVYARDDMNGSSLGTVNEASELELQDTLHGTGSGRVKINRHHTQAALLQQDRYVRVHSDFGVVGAFFLEEGVVDLSSDDGKGGEFITWTGRGPMAILESAVMDYDSNIVGGHDPIDGFWDLSNQGPLAGDSSAHPITMMKRALVEAKLQTPTGLGGVDHSSFDYDTDTNGDPIPFIDGEWGVNVGDDLLTVLAKLDQIGGVVFRMTPDFEFHAYLSYGTDRSGAFGAGNVRFEKGINIASSIARKVRGGVARTHLIVGGADRVFVTVTDPDYSTGDVIRWGFLSVPETDNESALEAAGLAHIEARKRQTDVWVIPAHDHGDNEATGIYEPGDHYVVGDTVSHHTGSGTYDANEQAAPVASITWQLKTSNEANGDYWVINEIGSTFHWDGNQGFDGTVPGSQHIPCAECPPAAPTPGTPGTPATEIATWTFTTGMEDDGGNGWFFENGGLGEGWDPSGHAFNSNSATAGIQVAAGSGPDATAGVTYHVSADVGQRPPSTSVVPVYLRIAWVKADLTVISTVNVGSATATGFTTVAGDVTAPTDTFTMSPIISRDTSSNLIQVDNVRITTGGSAGTPGDSTAPIVDNDETATPGTDTGTYAPIDHTHQHGYLSDDGEHAHDATDIEYEPTGGLTATDVQGALNELAAGFVSGEGISEDTDSGATHTIDITEGTVHDLTLTDDVTLTFADPDTGRAYSFTLLARQDGTGGRTITWPASVEWPDGTAPTLSTDADAVDILTFLTLDGGATWYGSYRGSGTAVAALDDLTDVTITAPAVGDMLRYNGSAWVNSPGRWEPVTTNPGTGPELVWDGDEIVMTWSDT